MIDAFQSMIRQQASMVQNSITQTQVGTVVAYDPATFTVIVQLYPQDADTPALQTGWIPLFTLSTNQQWGIFVPPSLGDLIEVHYQEGSLQNAYAGLRAIMQGNSPNVPSGEMWFIHASGSYVKITNDGKVSINGNVEIDVISPVVNITCATSATISAPVVNLGNGTLSTLMNGSALTIYNEHTHIDSTGHATMPPTQQMSSSNLTTNTQAS